MATNEARERWFCELIDAGLSEEIFNSGDLMEHATPEVLATNLPPDLMAKVLEAALSAGKMTTDRMLETLTPKVIAHHIPHEVLWACVISAAKRSGIADAKADVQKSDKRRTFLRRALDRGLDTDVLNPVDVVGHVTPEVLAGHLPNNLKAKLIAEGLRADAMNPDLIVEVVSVAELAAHIPLAVLWACLSEAGDRALSGAVVGAMGAMADKDKAKDRDKDKAKDNDKKDAKAANGGKRVAKVKKAGRAPTGDAPLGKPPLFDDDTNVNDWAGADDFEVVEEAELGAMTDQVLNDWAADEETNVGADPQRK